MTDDERLPLNVRKLPKSSGGLASLIRSPAVGVDGDSSSSPPSPAKTISDDGDCTSAQVDTARSETQSQTPRFSEAGLEKVDEILKAEEEPGDVHVENIQHKIARPSAARSDVILSPLEGIWKPSTTSSIETALTMERKRCMLSLLHEIPKNTAVEVGPEDLTASKDTVKLLALHEPKCKRKLKVQDEAD